MTQAYSKKFAEETTNSMSGSGKTIFVTGAGGFVASHTVIELQEEGYNIVAVDNFANSVQGDRTEMPESLRRVEKFTGRKIIFYKVDLCDKAALFEVFSKHKIDCVIHFAALKAVGESWEIPLKYYSNNVNGSNNLLEVMKEFDCKRIVFSSSSVAYGDPQYLPVDEKHPIGNCTSPYGTSKFMTELVIRDVCKAYPDWGAMLLRYFNPVGAHLGANIGEEPCGKPNNLVPYISQVAIGKREKLYIFGGDYDTPDGTPIRD